MQKRLLIFGFLATIVAGACTITTNDSDDPDAVAGAGNGSGRDSGGSAALGGASGDSGRANGGTAGGGTAGIDGGGAGGDGGGTAGDDGAGGDDGMSGSGGIGGDKGIGGDDGVGGDDTNPPVTGDSCDGPEAVPNDDRDSATQYELGSVYPGCLQDSDDVDFYEFTTPATGDGGYIKLSVTDVASTVNVDVDVWSAEDNGQFLRTYASTRGASALGFFTAEPGATFRIAVKSFTTVTVPGAYRLTASFHPVLDIHEPNDVRSDATSIVLDEPVEAYMFAGRTGSEAIPAAAWYDWYQVPLTPGDVSVTMSIPTADLSGDVYLYDTNGTQIRREYSTTGGSTVVLSHAITTAGTYYVRVVNFGSLSTVGATLNIPPYLTMPYTLTVTQ